jgi:acetyltransferase-like isoleucine patch superfamily enzyme
MHSYAKKIKLGYTYKILCKLGFKYPEKDYGDVTIGKVLKQFFTSIRRRRLINMMNWPILEPFNPRKLRPILLRKLGAKVGKDVFIGDYVSFDLNHTDLITIEDHVHIAGGCRLFCHKKELSNYHIGDDYAQQPYKYMPIHLCKGCAIGSESLVMPGVTVGEGAVVGAGSLVTKDIPAWTLALGRPAKVVKKLPKREEKTI